MSFLRVVEVFPPHFPLRRGADEPLGLDAELDRFVEDVRGIRDYGDLFLVASVKNPDLLKISTVEAALLLKERLGVKAAPVLVARDMNRLQFLSTIVTAISLDLDSLMVVWGDAYPASAKATNVRDFSSLANVLHEASAIRRQARSSANLLAPVDLNRLGSRRGVAQARERLRAGAVYLVAQPPTTDAEETFEKHTSLLEASGLKGRVMLNVFPFRDEKDARECEKYFGWKLPRRLFETASRGERALVDSERSVVRRLRAEGFPGVYLTTRGTPSVAQLLLS